MQFEHTAVISIKKRRSLSQFCPCISWCRLAFSADRCRYVNQEASCRFHSKFLAMRWRSEEHTSELQSLMRISYAVFCLKKKKNNINKTKNHEITYKREYTTQNITS